MCIALKGVEKILFVLVLRILLIFRFLKFTAVFGKKTFLVCIQFLREKVNFSLIHPTHITFMVFEEHY